MTGEWWACLAIALAAGLAGGAAGGMLYSRKRLRGIRAIVDALLNGVARERELVRLRRKLSSKPRRRYVVFEALPGGFREEEVREALKLSFERLSGALGIALSNVNLVYFDERTSRGILRVRSEYKSLALAALALTRNVGGRRALLVPLATTGTLKRARRLLEPR
ncbi:MAG: hypothetical protein LRS46_00955 [Desulfurococcales archaeon]|nr:hypothetical protein [Desulfurococcales archaeon]